MHPLKPLLAVLLLSALHGHAADHLDTPTVIADPAADIGDLYAWTSSDGRRLNLVMDIVGRHFSDQVRYVFHVDSGGAFGSTSASMRIECRFDARGRADCEAGTADWLQGDAGDPRGIEGERKRMRVFAGQRDDPYFNNVRGTRSALNTAIAAIRADKAPADSSGFRRFDAETLADIRTRWQQTDGGPAANFLAGWTTSALVVSVDLAVVTTGGPLLAVWATTERRTQPTLQIDRMGRALTGNALLGLLSDEQASFAQKEAYNRADRPGWPAFEDEIVRNLALYDGFDGVAGNQWRGGAEGYRRLARLLADDRLWIDSRQAGCEHYLAVERSASGTAVAGCGGRTPNHNVNGVFRSLLIRGTADVVDDGVDRDDRTHSTTEFPFLAAPKATTDGKLALANLDALIERSADDPASIDLLLLRLQFLADDTVLDRIAALTEQRASTADELLRRAQARAAAHRFADALRDLDAAEAKGAAPGKVRSARMNLWLAVGDVGRALPWLEAQAPDFANTVALARGYAAAERLEEADVRYAEAMRQLDTTSPFPLAALWFARGLMWSEQGGDASRGEAMYREALQLVPGFVTARVHLAELLVERGNLAQAMSWLEPVALASQEPEALALLGELKIDRGEVSQGRDLIERASRRYDDLLARHPLAFADHAAEFFLGAGGDAARALALARLNLSGRQTSRAHELVQRALQANGLLTSVIPVSAGTHRSAHAHRPSPPTSVVPATCFVIPAKAGTHEVLAAQMGPRLRGDDESGWEWE